MQRIAAAIHPRFSALVWVGATSGLRFGELTGLTRHHVDLDERGLRVEQAFLFIRDSGPTLGPPKSAAARRKVTIPVSVAQILGGHLDTYVEEGSDAFVFTSIKSSPLLIRYFAPSWKRALAQAGLPDTTRSHDLRHLAGTSAATARALLREIMSRVGHSSADASLRYLKASERRDSEVADAIEQRIRGDLVRRPSPVSPTS